MSCYSTYMICEYHVNTQRVGNHLVGNHFGVYSARGSFSPYKIFLFLFLRQKKAGESRLPFSA